MDNVLKFRTDAVGVLETALEIEEQEQFDSLLVVGMVKGESVALATKNSGDAEMVLNLLATLFRMVLPYAMCDCDGEED